MKSMMTSRASMLRHWLIHAVVVAPAITACAPVPAPHAGDASAAEVEAAFKAFEQAWEKEDLDATAAAFTADAVVDPVPPGRFEGTDAIRSWLSGSFEALEHISISSSQVRVQTQGTVGWGTSHYVFEAQQAGKPLRAEGDVTMVWVRQPDGTHKLSVFHASDLPAPSTG
jgi:uncharacterized protein (TIGR02246 family)